MRSLKDRQPFPLVTRKGISCYLGHVVLGLPAKTSYQDCVSQIVMKPNLEGESPTGDCSLHSIFFSEWK